MFKIWQTECIKRNETHGLNLSHSLFILLTKCGKTLILFPRKVPPTRIILLLLLIVIKSYESKNLIFFLIFSCFNKWVPRWSGPCAGAASSAFCIPTKINPSWHLAQLRYFVEIKSSWSRTEFSWKPPTTPTLCRNSLTNPKHAKSLWQLEFLCVSRIWIWTDDFNAKLLRCLCELPGFFHPWPHFSAEICNKVYGCLALTNPG